MTRTVEHCSHTHGYYRTEVQRSAGSKVEKLCLAEPYVNSTGRFTGRIAFFWKSVVTLPVVMATQRCVKGLMIEKNLRGEKSQLLASAHRNHFRISEYQGN